MDYPDPLCDHPIPSIRKRYRKTTREWRRYHGFGMSPRTQGELREIPDWEYADGTPATLSRTDYHREYFKNKLLFHIIQSAALVEQRIAQGAMPKIPSTKIQRDWDPNVPLFIEDDEHGLTPPNVSGKEESQRAVAVDLDEINDLKMRPHPVVWDRRKQYLTKELLVPRAPVGKRVMKEDWKPKSIQYEPNP